MVSKEGKLENKTKKGQVKRFKKIIIREKDQIFSEVKQQKVYSKKRVDKNVK